MIDVDFQRVLLNLRSAGVPVSEAAKRVGADWRTLGRVARGEVKSLRWEPALRLLDLHYDRCPEQHTRAQLTRR